VADLLALGRRQFRLPSCAPGNDEEEDLPDVDPVRGEEGGQLGQLFYVVAHDGGVDLHP